jgi:hypothetical protein
VATQKWSDLSKRSRRLIVFAIVVEVSLLLAALVDIKRRPASQIRGSKWLWTPLAFLNFIGPVSYFAVGRRWHSGS